MFVPPDDGLRYSRNMSRLTEYTKNNLYIKLVFLYMITHNKFGNCNLWDTDCVKGQLVSYIARQQSGIDFKGRNVQSSA